jgi:hypothetical protein
LGNLPEGHRRENGSSRVGLLFIRGKNVDGHLFRIDL